MKNQRDKLQQYQKRIVIITNRETNVARECLKKGDKRSALVALRRKKYQESLLQKTDQQLAQLEILTNDVEFALVQQDVLFGLRQGTAVLKQIHNEMGGIQHVEKLLGDTAEAQAYAKVLYFVIWASVICPAIYFPSYVSHVMDAHLMQEVSDLLAGRMSNQDEDEVEDELDALEREVSGVKLPDVPEGALPEAEQKETAKQRRERRAREQAAPQKAESMLA